jgi:hypothetical protein
VDYPGIARTALSVRRRRETDHANRGDDQADGLPGWPLAFGADQFEMNTASSGLSSSKTKVFSDPFHRSLLIRDRLWLT